MEATPSAPVPPRPVLRPNIVHRLRRWTTWFGVGRLIAAGASVVLVAVAAWWLLRTPHPSTESQLPYAPGRHGAQFGHGAAVGDLARPRRPASLTSSSTSPARSSRPASTTCRRVPEWSTPSRRPAAPVPRPTPTGSTSPPRCATAHASTSRRTASRSRWWSPATPPRRPAPDRRHPIDLNTATAEQLDDLPGVGPSTAAAIIAYRDAHGPFATAEDLGEVRGIGPAKLDALRGLVTT